MSESSTKTIQIPLVTDGETEASETFRVLLSNPTGGASLGSAEATVLSGQTRIYRSFHGTRYEAEQDTSAFATCDL